MNKNRFVFQLMKIRSQLASPNAA